MNNRTLKTAHKISAMRSGGAILARIRREVLQQAKPGVTLRDLDKLAEKLILDSGGKPSFKMVSGYHYTTCINLNEGIVHGIPGPRKIQDGDLVSVDVGIYYHGFHTDAASSQIVGRNDSRKEKFLRAGRTALTEAIKQAKPGNRISDISKAIQDQIESRGYSCSKSLTGHGVGKKLHEEPMVPCIFPGFSFSDSLLIPGQTLAVEVIYTEGSEKMTLAPDGWTLSTQDNRLAGLFEETILITDKQPEILTK